MFSFRLLAISAFFDNFSKYNQAREQTQNVHLRTHVHSARSVM